MDHQKAKKYAAEALLWLAQNSQHLESFLLFSGANPSHLRTYSKDPKFLSFVLDFFMTSDKLIIELSKDSQLSPEQIQKASAVLSSGDLPHWT